MKEKKWQNDYLLLIPQIVLSMHTYHVGPKPTRVTVLDFLCESYIILVHRVAS